MENAPNANPTTSIVETLIELRLDAGYTLEELADRSGMHRTSLGLIERGERGLTIESASNIANALDISFENLVVMSAARQNPNPTPAEISPLARRLDSCTSLNSEKLFSLTGLTSEMVLSAIEYVYETFDLIDMELIARGSQPISKLVELANLSSMIGNLLGAGLAKESDGRYVRNRPHAFPDLVPQSIDLPNLEIKTALETNMPKGHLPKAGVYLTFRYSLGEPNGDFKRGKENRGSTVWIWESRVGHLDIEDFSISNTDGDSGKTANIRTKSLQSMVPVFYDSRFCPYARPWGGL